MLGCKLENFISVASLDFSQWTFIFNLRSDLFENVKLELTENINVRNLQPIHYYWICCIPSVVDMTVNVYGLVWTSQELYVHIALLPRVYLLFFCRNVTNRERRSSLFACASSL